MAAAALVLSCASLALTFGVRIALQWRRTGSTGVHRVPAGAPPAEWLAGALFVMALVLGLASPALVLLEALAPIARLDGATAHAIGVVLAVAGILATFGIQLAMGDSWRIGVDPDEQLRLVTYGPFALVRNPIYGAMLPSVLGLVLMVPTVLAVVAFLAMLTALELQVRMVEEPYLLRTHGKVYADYASRVGRFLPGVGILHGVR